MNKNEKKERERETFCYVLFIYTRTTIELD